MIRTLGRIVSLFVTASFAEAQQLYTADFGTSSTLYRIDDFLTAPNAVALHQITPSGVSMQDLAANPSTGVLYAVDGSSLYSLDKGSGATSNAKLLTPPGVGWNSLEIGPDGTAYAGGFFDTRLFTVNLTNGEGSELMNTHERFLGDIAFDPVSGDLFVLTFANNDITQAHLQRVNIQTRQITLLSTIGHVLTGIEITNHGRIIVVSSHERGVWEVDRVSGQLTLIQELSGNHGVGAALVDPCPAIVRHPAGVTICTFASVAFTLTQAGASPFTYQWQWQPAGPATAWINLATGNNAEVGGVPVVHAANVATATLEARPLAGYTNFAPRAFRCVVTNSCASVTSNQATLTVCAADFDCDGTVDFFDYDAFVTCFEGGACPAGRTADFDNDGTVDFFDYDSFVVAFEAGC